MIASRSFCRFVSRSTTSQSCSIGLRSGDCGGHLSKVNSLSCSRNQSEMIWALWRCIILLEVHQKMVHCSHKGMDMVSNNTQAFKRCSIGTKGPKVCQENIPHTIIISKFLPSESRSRNRDSSDQATFFQSSIVQFWWFCVNCILRVLFLSDRSGTRCGLLLLEPICVRVRCVVCSEMVFCIPWL